MTLTGIDTNILLRMVVNDDPHQRKLALGFGERLNAEHRGFVSLMVLVEFAWSLATHYRKPPAQVVAAVRTLLRIRTLVFESHDAIVRALERTDLQGSDFADALIAEHHLDQGCVRTVTFDRKAARIPSMELLS